MSTGETRIVPMSVVREVVARVTATCVCGRTAVKEAPTVRAALKLLAREGWKISLGHKHPDSAVCNECNVARSQAKAERQRAIAALRKEKIDFLAALRKKRESLA